MRVFEKISRRLAIYMAGVVAASTFAVPMAPAITAYAIVDLPAGIEKPTDSDDFKIIQETIGTVQGWATEAKNGETIENVELERDLLEANELPDKPGDNKAPDNTKVYKIKSGIDGKLHVTVKAKEAAKKLNIDIFKKDTVPAALDENIENLAKDAESDKAVDVKKNEEWYVVIANSDKDAKAKIDITLEIRQNGKKTKLRSVESPAKKTAKATFKKVKDVDGYEVMVSTSKDFDKNVKKASKKAKKVKFDKKKAGSIEVKKLKAGKKYYVRVRTYVEEGGVKYYSDWSSVKKIKKVK